MSQSVSQIERNYNKKELSQEVFTLRAKEAQREKQNPQIQEADERAGQEALGRVTSATPEEMASEMTALGVNLNNTVQQVTSKIIQGRNTLNDLDRACTAKTEELTNLFGQEVIALSIGEALASHDAKKKDFAAAEAELAENQSRAEVEFDRQQREQQAQFNKDCQRDRTEFGYKFNQEQREQKDALGQALKAERRQFDEDQRIAQRDQAESESDLQKRILVVAEQEAEAEALEEQLKAKFDKEKHTATGAMKREHEHATAILSNNAQTAAKIAASTIETVSEQLLKQQTEIEQLKTALAASQEKNTDLAGKAIDGASHQFALDTVARLGADNGSTGRAPRGKA